MHSPAAHNDTLALLKAGALQGSTRLKLSCGLTEFPREIFALADTLEILDLTGNALSSLPGDLYKLTKLRILFCSSNQFTQLPAVLGQCQNLSMIGFKANQLSHIPEQAIPTKHLRWFIVTDNQLTHLPDALGDCAQLQKLMLAGNQLTDLPVSMVNCQQLELLRISANQFAELPAWLFELPKLTWLAYAGNPFSDALAHDTHPAVNHIDWQHLTLQQVLGEGASGITYQALWQPPNKAPETVAVKMFKSGLTSDGLPECEMQANVLAGEHPNLIGIHGVIQHHPENALGLVMPLLDADLQVLADPPSFDSCTRDVYADGLRLSTQQVQHISQGIAKAVQHLHGRGLIHGDLYAHNILWNDQQVVLSDLGGASLLPLDNPTLTQQLQQLDLRALTILQQELQALLLD
ncbi:MAG TPA: leucine-rich repeat-containing protein kinase family protein [Methylophilus sp.]